ncbi:hypothetical protein GPA27_00405 [Aromatoleum toluolicum]|uniref:Glycosyltransferase RgtA/B/C/D-like domain-containing protein n=1 Tax=Aromatoleum toluolicum TaxID=90060 RepID=A0ABX1N9A5_9RHOO|nr:hypothetical protein [Aromatoleum toluolicum]NMF95865.1 hypothetical protein [Aromatoleum toluolicum]
MTGESFRTSTIRRHLYGATGLALLIALYLLTGLTGHDPWRGDDARHFGPILEMLQGNHLLFPAIAGQPETDFPPLYYWTGAAFARLLAPFLPMHDGARLATTLFTALAIFWIARAATRLYGRETRTPAALLTLGTLGLVLHAHETQPMIALMAMQALTLAGLSHIPTRPVLGGVQAGLGAALAFLAGGLPGIVLTLPLFLVVIACSPEWRSPRASSGLIIGLSLAIGASALWPLVLHYQSPDLLALWWRAEWRNLWAEAMSGSELTRLVELIGWFAWPLWPITLWSLWRTRRHLLRASSLLPIAALVLTLVWIILNGSLSPASMLPLVPPLALLAASGIPTLRRGAANAFDWFGIMTFGVFAILVWIAWSAQVFLWPPGLARHLVRVAPDFALRAPEISAITGIVIVTVWVLLMLRLPRSPNRAPANWALGMTMLWCLAIALLKPWFDHDRSYRPAATSLKIALAGEREDCVAMMGLSASQRASFHYFADIRPERVVNNETQCGFLLVFDDRGSTQKPAQEWQQIWEFRRGGGRQREIFRLYRRD